MEPKSSASTSSATSASGFALGELAGNSKERGMSQSGNEGGTQALAGAAVPTKSPTVGSRYVRAVPDPRHRTELLGGHVTWFFGDQGAHFRLPGFIYTRNSGLVGWSTGRSWRFLGLICIRHNETQGGALKHCQPAGWTVKFATVRWAEIRRAIRKADNYVS